MIVVYLLLHGRNRGANVHGLGAARVELAALRCIQRRRNVAL